MNKMKMIWMQKKIAEMSVEMEKHLKKRCGYCDYDMGFGVDFQVFDFLQHMKQEHPDKISAEQMEQFEKLVLRLM